MPLAPGTQLGPYEILARIGAGGMGEVYRARDPRLNRDVAIKVSAAQFSERFEREARAVAALNHPNICTLFDVGPNYLVMELVEGESPKGPLPLETALDYARQIAAALEEAHDKGIVHRDLKPGNVKITPGGTVKVLDFGLAKYTSPAREGGMSENSPTISMAATQAGVILGTAAYMSPEQAKGKQVDKRADIWAFGVVLYEMVTGRQPFHCDDVSETLAAVIMKDPELEPVPVELRKLLKRCLEKDPKKRLRDITGMELLLEGGLQPAQDFSPAPSRPRFALIATSATAVVFFLALAALAYVHFRETPPPAEVMRFQIQPPEKSSFDWSPRVSPDGRRIAFTAPGPDGRLQVWVRTLASLESRLLTGTDEGNGNLFWSPDSHYIAFPAQGKLKKIEASGGPPETICDIPGNLRGGAWNRDGLIIFGTTTGTFRVPQAGGTATQIVKLDASRQESQHAGPVFLPDDRHFLYHRNSTTSENAGLYLGSVDLKPEQQNVKRLLATGNNPIYSPSQDPRTGYVLFLREGTLMSQGFDNGKLELTGEAVPVAEGVGNYFTQGFFSASTTGVLVFRSGGTGGNRQYTWFDRQGKNLGAALEPGLYNALSLSPDGTQVAGDRQVGGAQPDVWLLQLASRVNTQFTFEPALDDNPIWSPDGSHVAFSSGRDGGRDLYQKVSTGAGKDELLLKSPELKVPKDWSRDGKFLLYVTQMPKTGTDLMALPMDGADRKPIPVVQTEAGEDQGQFSPDSHWVAYRSDAGGRNEIYVRPFPPAANGGQWKVSNNGGVMPRWNRSGKELFYIAPDGKLMAVDVSAAGGSFKFGIPQPLFDPQIYGGGLTPGAMRFDVTADGKRFLSITQVTEATSSPITVILNWPALLKR